MTLGATAKTDLPADARLKITEIFFSLQGEADTAGKPTVFIRLTGCPLRCRYCDTEYAFHGGRWMSFAQIESDVASFDTSLVCVTGGEPLAQSNCNGLLQRLCDVGFTVSLETSGAIDIAAVDPRVIRVMDLKTPGSGELSRNRYENVEHLRSGDMVKFVVCDRDDYEWSVATITKYDLSGRCEVLFSPSYGQLQARTLADWILEDRLPVRLQIQLHKYLWGEAPGH